MCAREIHDTSVYAPLSPPAQPESVLKKSALVGRPAKAYSRVSSAMLVRADLNLTLVGFG
jgi:hypothetical protein